MVEQRYDAHGDALVVDGKWWCEHDEGYPPVAVADLHRQLEDPGTSDVVVCPDCATGWVCWARPSSGQRLAKPVVVRIET